MASVAVTEQPRVASRLLLFGAGAQLLVLATIVAAQFHFVFPAEEQSSPAGVYELANLVLVAVFGLGAGLLGGGTRAQRAPLIAVGAMFAAVAAYEILYWDVETWGEDWGALALWTLASLALFALSRSRRLPAFASALLGVAALAKFVALGADIADDGGLALDAADLAESWTYVVGTALSGAAAQLGVLFVARQAGGLSWSSERGVGARLAGALADARFAAWRRAHPGKTYGDYYGHRLSARLARGGSHKTLGAKVHRPGDAGAAARRYATEQFAQRGARHRDWFFSRGVTPDMSCVDYGCGSLRIGQHFIRRLEPGRWMGLDVVEAFYRDGLALIEPETVAEKRPEFAVISPEGLEAAKARRPDLVYSTAVLQHVPPGELGVYLGNLAALIEGGGVAVANFKHTRKLVRIGPNAWSHEAERIVAAAAEADPWLAVAIEDDGQDADEDFARATLVMSRDRAALAKWVRRPLEISGA
ncbi:class I SAM-dependent methyltransferase [Hansschlegelia zhihuaiae]|uniref:class I SAM-dependent methyltransferase n=1 Tax=Hansschlegelia zhihuaiae TaxID=405005 RepID=UPI0013E8CB22|nr:class I SAM-dependent methyltransferase [Hansschlegelia zhihuaiae]